MKIFEKWKQKPAEGEQPKPESALLKTYLTSLLCMMLCVVMFLSTTYAWFSSEVDNNNNEIYIGILDVELEKKLEDDSWASLSAKQNDVSVTNLFDRNIRWEPGYTSLETVKVINEGDLAINFTLSFTDGRFSDRADAPLAADAWKDVAKYFDIWVYDHRANGDEAPTAASYAQITAEGSGWLFAGSLEEALDGKPVFEGAINNARDRVDSATEPTGATVADPALEGQYTIALHMREDAESAIMGHKIRLNVKLVAYQQGYENDHFNANYDSSAKDTHPVYSEQQLRGALADGKTPYIANHIALSEPIVITGDTRIAGGSYPLTRGEGFTGVMFLVKEDATLTLDNVILEGGGIWSDAQPEATGIVATGSLIAAQGKSSIVLEKGTVLQNNDGFSAVALGDECTLTVSGAQLLHNRAPEGGAIHGGAKITVDAYTEIRDNRATSGNGGAIWSNGVVEILGGAISGNQASQQGGALYLGEESSFTILAGQIGGNSAVGIVLKGSASFVGGELSDAVSLDGQAQIGNTAFIGMVICNGSTVSLAKEFSGFSFQANDPAAFVLKPAEGYSYEDGDEAKLICLNTDYVTAWDAASSAFVLKAK